MFLDIGLPGMDGYELVQRMRQIPVCAEIPIVALSGDSSPADRRRALAAGFTTTSRSRSTWRCSERSW